MIVEWLKIIGVVGGLVGLLYAVRTVGRCYGWHPEWQRKTLHVGLGLTALTFPWLFDATWQVGAVCGLGAGVMVAVRTVPRLRRSVGCSLHDVGRASFGELLFALAIVLLFALAQGVILHYLLPLAILTLADSGAALIGVQWGHRQFLVVDGRKSWEGVVAFAGITTVLTIVSLALLTTLSWPIILLLTMLVTVIGTLIEAVAWHGLDNVLVPLGIFLALVSLQESSMALLFYQLAGLGVVMVAIRLLPIHLATHTALMGILVSYCLWSGGPLFWLPLLLVLLLTHTVLEKRLTGPRFTPFEAMPMHYWLAAGRG